MQKQNLVDNGATTTVFWGGGLGTVAVTGDFGGGTLVMEASFDGSQFISVGNDTMFTDDGMSNFHLPANCYIRLTLSGATSPDIDIWVLTTVDRVEDND